MVEIRQFVSVDLSCVIVLHLVSCIVQRFVCFLCIFVYFTITDSFKTSCFFKSRTESAYSCKDIKIFYQYESSPFRFFQQKNGQAFFQNLTVTLIYSFLHLLLAHYLHLRYGNRPRLGSLRAFCRYVRYFCCVGFDSLFL